METNEIKNYDNVKCVVTKDCFYSDPGKKDDKTQRYNEGAIVTYTGPEDKFPSYLKIYEGGVKRDKTRGVDVASDSPNPEKVRKMNPVELIEPARKALVLSVCQNLDHANDDHWNEKGYPNLGVVSEQCGFPVTMDEVKNVAPDCIRDEEKAQAPVQDDPVAEPSTSTGVDATVVTDDDDLGDPDILA